MYDKREDRAVLMLSFIPVVIAMGGLVVNFNTVDMIYLLVVLTIFLKYYCNKVVSQNK